MDRLEPRQWISAVAALLCAVALAVSVLDDAAEALAFFTVALVAAALQAWAGREPYEGPRRGVSVAIALLWWIAAAWIGVLLLMYQSGSSRPEPLPEATYLGLTATVYHLVALYGGALLVAVAAAWPMPELPRTVRRQ